MSQIRAKQIRTSATGDLLVGNGTNGSLLSIGSTGQVLTVVGGTAQWAAPDLDSVFRYMGTVDAPNAGSLPATPVQGDYYKVTTTGGTANFNGTWDASGLPVGATFRVGDAIVYNGTAWDKIDNTNSSVAGTTNRITVTTDNVLETYTVDIASTYVGQTSITTLGTVGTGTWQGSLVGRQFGGTGTDTSSFPDLGLAYFSGTGTTMSSVAAPVDGGGDVYLRYNDTTDAIEWATVPAAPNTFGVVALSGNTSGDLTLTADTTADTVTMNGGIGITLTGTASSDTMSIAFTNSGMADTAVVGADTVPFFDASNTGEPEFRSFTNILADLDIVTATADGIIVRTAADTYASRTITASAAADLLGISVTNGDGVAGNPTIGLNIDGLTSEPAIVGADTIAFYDASADANRKISVTDLTAAITVDFGFDEATATGGANEAFVGFFSDVPATNAGITVFFNGVALRATGWTRSGADLTLVDSVNGYSAEAGDIITASYQY